MRHHPKPWALGLKCLCLGSNPSLKAQILDTQGRAQKVPLNISHIRINLSASFQASCQQNLEASLKTSFHASLKASLKSSLKVSLKVSLSGCSLASLMWRLSTDQPIIRVLICSVASFSCLMDKLPTDRPVS